MKDKEMVDDPVKQTPSDERKIKYIKLKKGIKEDDVVIALQNWIIAATNSSLVSISIHRLCKRFVRDLKKIPLSEELQ